MPQRSTEGIFLIVFNLLTVRFLQCKMPHEQKNVVSIRPRKCNKFLISAV